MDYKELKDFIKAVAKSGVSEVDIKTEGMKLTVKVNSEGSRATHTETIIQQVPVHTPLATGTIMQQPIQNLQTQVQTPQENTASTEKAEDSNYITIKSPMVGTFYRKPSPDKDPFVNVGDNINDEDRYEYIDDDPNYKVGESRYYAVVSVDDKGNRSGLTNLTKFTKNIPSVEEMTDIHVVPNPFVQKSGFEGEGDDRRIGFYGLPEKCTIRIFSYSGQLIDKIEHDDAVYSHEKIQVTRNGQDMASGIYFYVVTTPEGEQTHGKFIILK